MINGHGIHSCAFGFAETERLEPCTATTPFDVASQTKLATITTLLRLRDAGLVDLHAPVSRYVPDTSDASVFDVMTHQSGLPRDWAPGDDKADLLHSIERAIQWHGTRSTPAYSNVGYAILGAAIAAVTREPASSFIDRSVFRPLGMTDCGWSSRNGAIGYGPLLDGARKRATQQHDFIGATGMWATPTDMCKLAWSLLGHRPDVLSRDAVTLATATHVATGAEYGLGIEVQRLAGERWLGHSGGSAGCVSATYFSKVHDIAFSVAMNAREPKALAELCQAIASACNVFTSSSVNAHQLTGRYRGEFGILAIIETARGLFACDPLEWNPFRNAYLLRYDGDRTWRVVSDDFNVGGTKLHIDGDVLYFGGHPMQRIQDANAIDSPSGTNHP